MNTSIHALREILLNDVLAEVRRQHPDMPLASIQELALVRETRVAFENLCSNLAEGDRSLSPALLDKIAVLGRCVGVDRSYWMGLRPA